MSIPQITLFADMPQKTIRLQSFSGSEEFCGLPGAGSGEFLGISSILPSIQTLRLARSFLAGSAVLAGVPVFWLPQRLWRKWETMSKELRRCTNRYKERGSCRNFLSLVLSCTNLYLLTRRSKGCKLDSVCSYHRH